MTYVILVDGLPPAFSSDQLRRLFVPYGTVRSVIFASPTKGHTLGFGYIQMASDSEAVQAVKALHGTPVSGYPIGAYLW